jgi:NADH:ubiquinone oxidoreductase subunit 4 (subunit M)
LRFMLPLYQDVTIMWWWPIIATCSVGSIVFASINALRQLDIKRIIAYSSIAHMNLAVLGMFSYTYVGIHGSVILMLAHGFVSGALFILIGVIYVRFASRLVHHYGGLVQVMPLFATFFLFFSIANMGFPGTYNFVGELLSMIGIGTKNWGLAIAIGFGLFASALYSIWLANRLLFGNIKVTYIKVFSDLTGLEFFLFILLIFLTLVFGICPQYVDAILDTSIYWILN